MNETEQIFTHIFAFGLGYAIAFSVKNVGRIYKEWGLLISGLLFPSIAIGLIFAAAMIADKKSLILSSVFGAGFLIRMLKSRS